MSKQYVNNKVRLAGKVVYMNKQSKFVSLIIDTGPEGDAMYRNKPRVVAFEKVIPFLRNINTGDYVLVDATIQSNKDNPATPRTYAVNHVKKINPEKDKYQPVNRFHLNGRIFKPQKINNNLVSAYIYVKGNQSNILKVYFYSQEKDKIDALLNADNQLAHLTGAIQTGRDFDKEGNIRNFERLMIRNFNIFDFSK